MKRDAATARRYARALFLVAREAGRLEPVGEELERFAAVVRGDRRLTDVLLRPWVKADAKKAVTTALAGRLKSSKLVTDFLGLLAARGRLDHLAAIAGAYQGLLDQEQGRVRARVRTRVALTDAERKRLRGRLGGLVGREVILEEAVDPALLGGFVAQVGSLVVDGSLDGQLARMRERLVRG